MAVRNQLQDLVWKNHVTRFRSKQISQAAYCRAENLNKNTFGYWLKKITSQETETKLVEITPDPGKKQDPDKYVDIILGTNIKVRVTDTTDQALLLKTIRLLENSL